MSESTSPLENIFEERAEFLSRKQLESWTSMTNQELQTLKKLTGAGPKLLIGPRGSGKSTLLKQAFFRIEEEQRDFGVYVNYSKSLALEPLFKTSTEALTLFRQWVLAKIVAGFHESITMLQAESNSSIEIPATLAESMPDVLAFVRALEAGKTVSPKRTLTPSELTLELESLTDEIGRSRCILLLDDAAHAFSPEQQREFFEIFRELRSRRVSPKAAVYPGITSYSPNFHVGHEAEKVEAWFRPEEEDYLDTMRDILYRRLPHDLFQRLSGKEELVDMLALASFGLPRGFIAMIAQLLGIDDESAKTPTRARALESIRDQREIVQSLFNSLSSKLPRYRNFVEVGDELVTASLAHLQRFNGRKSLDEKASTLALQGPLGAEVTKMLELLEYAGILRRNGPVSHGDRSYSRYSLHYAYLIEHNSLSLGRSYLVSDIVQALSRSSVANYPRVQAVTLLGRGFEKRCTIDLAPCNHCGADRASEQARFCIQCGRELEAISVYEELLKAPIANLGLTNQKLERILSETPLRTVNDILVDEENTHLRSVRSIGPIWCERIRRYADEYVSV